MGEQAYELTSQLSNDLSLRWLITALHFLWQGSIIAMCAAIPTRLLQARSASLRYAIHCVAMLSLPICVVTTFAMVDFSQSLPQPADTNSVTVAPVDNSNDPVFVAGAEVAAFDAKVAKPITPPQFEAISAEVLANDAVPAAALVADRSKPVSALSLPQAAPWVCGIYICGACFFLMRTGLALWGGRRMRNRWQLLSDPALKEMVRAQARRVGLRMVPAVAYCQRVTVPTVIGVLRPMILLPGSIVTGLSSQELSAVLSHELAHIRRYDLWMNLMQRMIEALLFFHPAVWFISRRVSAEREVCCDDLVLRAGHSSMNYAGALLRMAELCVAISKPQLATLSAGGHSPAELERRIERLLNIRQRSRFRLTRAGAIAMMTLLLAVAATPAMLSTLAQDKPTVEQSDEEEKPAEITARSVPITWDFESGRNIRWRMPLGSMTWRAPLVHGDQVYIGSNNQNSYIKRYPSTVDLGVLLCFDKSDGKFLWQHSNEKLATGRVHDWPMQGATSRPCVEGDRLWYITNRCELVCLDTQGFRDSENDGPIQDEDVTDTNEADVVWRLDMMKELDVSPHNGCTCTVAVWKDRIFAVTGNGVNESHVPPLADAPSFIAVDKTSGKLLWSDSSPGQNVQHGQWGSPAVAQLAGKAQVIFPGGDGWLYSFDPLGDGLGKSKLLWKFDCNAKDSRWLLGGQGTRNNLLHAPTIHKGLLYVAMGQDPEHGPGPGRLWCIDPSGSGDVSPELVFNKSDPETPIAHRRIQACDAEKGDFTRPNPNSKAVWQFYGV